MNYNELLEQCKDYDTIIVSGPQRSGTTYGAFVIAKDLKYMRVDENAFGVHRYDGFSEKIKPKSVIQAPALTHKLHHIDSPSTLIIFMMRDDKEIQESEDRIEWHPSGFIGERRKYYKEFLDYKDVIDLFERSSPMKKWIWKNYQKDKMQVDYVEFNYNELKNSSHWVDSKNRKEFKSKQIK
jgi:hypothetical protein